MLFLFLFFLLLRLWFTNKDACFSVEELRDSTAHAEMLCIREASSTLRTWRLSVVPCTFMVTVLETLAH